MFRARNVLDIKINKFYQFPQIEIRPSTHQLLGSNLDEKDRPSDVALLPDGRLVVMVETSPDARDTSNPQKTFVQIY